MNVERGTWNGSELGVVAEEEFGQVGEGGFVGGGAEVAGEVGEEELVGVGQDAGA